MDEVIKHNRYTLASVKQFINEKDWKTSGDTYGLPDFAFPHIDKPINYEPTYVDLLMYLSKYMKKDFKYLELGVSVLKTFYQVANYITNGTLYAYDINDINPTVEKLFTKEDNHYNFKTNKIEYFKGNVFLREDLQRFKKEMLGDDKIDMIFSDANHSYEGLKSEYENLISEILAKDFVLYYDDLLWDEDKLTGEKTMNQAFLENAQKISKNNPNVKTCLLKVNGWIGQHEYKHCNGLITTLPIEALLQGSKITSKIIK
jgi:predicted O-methyltransferase YrrM